jgi:hypothetical protein
MKKRITAHELIQRQNADSAFAARRAKEEQERERQEAEWRKAEAPLRQELHTAGYGVDSAWDLVNTSTPYPQALPILLRHVALPYPAPVREGIARALAVRDARFAFPVLMQLFAKEHDKRVKDGLAVAVAQTADDEVIGDVIALARDPQHGASRTLLLSALKRSKDPRARAALMELCVDPDIGKAAQRLLSGRRRPR